MKSFNQDLRKKVQKMWEESYGALAEDFGLLKTFEYNGKNVRGMVWTGDNYCDITSFGNGRFIGSFVNNSDLQIYTGGGEFGEESLIVKAGTVLIKIGDGEIRPAYGAFNPCVIKE